MKHLQTRWTTLLDQQHQLPNGLLGRAVGARMAAQHAPETAWSIDLLRLQPTDRVLELGFGAGHGLHRVAQHTHSGTVVGVDRSATMLRAARRRNQALIDTGRLALLRGDIATLPFAAASFTKIFSIHTLYFWSEPLCVFADLLGLLRPGGLLVVTLSTGVTTNGELVYGALQATLETTIIPALQALDAVHATLLTGPNSRHYNSVAVVVERR